MPILTEPSAIRAVLETDRSWSVYALGDLEPGFFEHCAWWGQLRPVPALVLIFRAFTTPVLFALGPPAAVQSLLDEVPESPRIEFSLPPALVPLVASCYELRDDQVMWRMVLSGVASHRFSAV